MKDPVEFYSKEDRAVAALERIAAALEKMVGPEIVANSGGQTPPPPPPPKN